MVINRSKRMLLVLCLIMSSFWQPPLVKAQAVAAAPLIQMGLQLVPLVLPFVVTGLIVGVRATSMAPAYLKERLGSIPRPHLRRGKQLAQAEEPMYEEETEEAVSEEEDAPQSVRANASVSADLLNNAERKSGNEQESESRTAAQEEDVQEETAPRRPAKQAKAADNSDWYMEE